MEDALSSLHRRENSKIIRPIPGEVTTLAEVMDFLPDLNIHGFRCYGWPGAAKHRELRDELMNPNALGGLSPSAMEQLSGWLSSFVPSRRWKQHSYALKHTFERETGTYLMDGAFIVCVLMAGFAIKIASPSALIKMQRPAR